MLTVSCRPHRPTPIQLEIVALARSRKTTELATVRSGLTERKSQKTYIEAYLSLPSVTVNATATYILPHLS
jgi:hypothetical protein